MKKLLLPIFGVAMPLMAMASTEWTLSKAEWPYQVDTTYHASVGPGTTLTKMTLTSLPRPSDGKTNTETPLIKAFYMTVDLTNPDVKVKTWLAGDKRDARQTVPAIAENHETDDVQVIGGVNSDFFNMSKPYLTNGAVVTDGFYIAPQNTAPWAHLMLDANQVPSFIGDISDAQRTIKINENASPATVLVNKARGTNAYVIYFEDEFAWQPVYTRDEKGSEVYIKPVGDQLWGIPSSEWEVVGTPTAANTEGNVLSLENGKYVLSGGGAAGRRVAQLKPGDRITVTTSIASGGKTIRPYQLAGGRQMILTNGVQIDISSSNAPRTLVGTSEDGKSLVLMCIDGRDAGGSYGAYYRLCAAIMQAVGCHNAMEFDGGGSTTMYVKPLGGVQNIPSEGTLRSVAEGVFVTTSAVDNWNVTRIEVVEKGISVPVGTSFTPTVYGFNPKGILIDPDVTGFMLECDDAPAAISFDGKKFTPTAEGMYALRVNYGQLSVAVPVKVGDQSGIDGIVADQNAQVEYFNLQGVRVDNPDAGLYIRRQGTAVDKVVIK